MSNKSILTIKQLWGFLENVCDPEVPVLTVLDLGVVRRLIILKGDQKIDSQIDAPENLDETFSPAIDTVEVQITPTYTGCPAMSMISANICLELKVQGIDNVVVKEILSPAWTTDWMRESGKQKLKEYGIAPPQSKARMEKMLFSDIPVPCPLCGSTHTERIAEFGSTACKSLHRCLDCREPFDYFKCH